MIRIAVTVLVLTGLTAVSGCETFRGFGRDVSNAGNAVFGG